ncbi:MAG TPA: hypothetical protein VLG16_00455 [Candidatus Saccharimonadales bacterium]|nr:hypothetical protein [Candidatus Saccharimonadales bacterium]
MYEQRAEEIRYYQDTKRILSNIALVNAGAEFESGQLLVPIEHIRQIAQEDPSSSQEIPDQFVLPDLGKYTSVQAARICEEKVAAAKADLRKAYRVQRLAQTIERLDPTQPAAYLQTIRDYIQQNEHDKHQSDVYSLDDPSNITSIVKVHALTFAGDIRYILPHRKLSLGSDEWSTNNWSEVLGQSWPPFGYQVENGFINHAYSLYGMTARMALQSAQYELPSPDVPISTHSLPWHQRDAILQTMYSEWQAFIAALPWETLQQYNMRAKRPLLTRNVDELRAAYQQYPQIPRTSIAATFIYHPHIFDRSLAAKAAKIAAAQIKAPQEQPSEPSLTERELEMRAYAKEVLTEDNPYTFSAALEPGETISVEKIEDINTVVFSALAQLDAKATELYGPALGNVWESVEIEGSESPAKKVIPEEFYGKLEKPRVVILPVDDAYIDSLKYGSQIDRNSLVRLSAIVDMRSTGRGIIGQSILDIVLFTRHAEDTHKRSHAINLANAKSGKQAVRYLRKESNAVAYLVLQHALDNPYSGGRMNPK